jgi:hypothetical protein
LALFQELALKFGQVFPGQQDAHLQLNVVHLRDLC